MKEAIVKAFEDSIRTKKSFLKEKQDEAKAKEAAPPKRGAGRPRKEEAVPVKRGPGRPRKVVDDDE